MAQMRFITALLWLLAAAPLFAQEDARPDLSIREPERAARGRVAVLFSDLNLTYFWGDPQAHSRAPSLRFGVNLLVFAIDRQQAGPALR